MVTWDAGVRALNHGTKDELQIIGWQLDVRKLLLTALLTVLTGGLLLILITWRPSIKLWMTHRRCDDSEAKRLLVKDIYDQLWEEEVVREEVQVDGQKGTHSRVYFINKKIKYVWDEATCTFVRLRPLEHGTTFNTFHRQSSGLSEPTAKAKKTLFGENFMKIEILSIWQLIVQQAYNPFYIFQAYTVILWCMQAYYLFAVCIAVLSVVTITIMVWETRRQSRALRKTVTSQSQVTVLRDDRKMKLSSRELVPGDVMLISDGLGRMEVDAVVLQGSVVVNEAMLTGESVPITKIAIPKEDDTMFSEEEHKRHFLYSGTEVLQVRGGKELPVLVINTGFYTARGELVRSILFPKPIEHHFYGDFLKLLGVFLLIGLGAMVWSLFQWAKIRAAWDVVFLSLDLVTFVVPSVLPATITAINACTQQRLKRKDVYCLSSNYISLSGSVDTVCFDKTGTLTEDDLALAGVIPCTDGDMGSPIEDVAHLQTEQSLTRALATCHSLTSINGRLVGYPIDTKIFSGIGWNLLESDPAESQDYGMVTLLRVQPPPGADVLPEEHEVAVLKTFPFESKEQRTTVITRRRNSPAIEVFIKGAPEKVASLCHPDTVPGIVEAALEWYTRQGLRVVAVAGKTLQSGLEWEKVDLTPREVLEEGAMFLGLVLLQNKLKVETAPVLAALHQAEITTVMITGDNLLTALSVARQSGLVSAGRQMIVVKAQYAAASAKAAQHLKVYYFDADYDGGLRNQRSVISVRNDNYALATDGETFDLIYRGLDKDLFQRLVHKGRVFARMKPEQKITVVEALQDQGHQVAMCGDGCNDCGALKVAHTGISLSSAEASVAAPFTSRRQDITCVPTLLLEGRATLVSIFAAFKYNVASMFGALICVVFHFSIFTEPSDEQYVTMDLVLATIPVLVMGYTGPTDRLVPRPPTRRILTFLPAASIFSFLIFQTLVYWLMLFYLRVQPWFVPFEFDPSEQGAFENPPKPSFENTELIIINYYTYVICALVFSHGAPYRKPIYTNYILTAYLLASTVLCIFINFYKGEWMIDLLNFKAIPSASFSAMIFLVAIIYGGLTFLWEHWWLYGVIQDRVIPWLEKTCGPRSPHAKLEAELRDLKSWPPLTDPPDIDADNGAGETDDGDEAMDSEALGKDEAALLIRKLTRRHRFKATVKYRNEVNPGHSSPTDIPVLPAIAMTTTTPPLGFDEESCPMMPFETIPSESTDYREPWDSQHGEGSTFKFNQSVRHQIMTGTKGGFSTFKGSVKKHNQKWDIEEAEPYEVIRLTDQSAVEQKDVNGEEIYATISETYNGDLQRTEDIDQGEDSHYQDPVQEQTAAPDDKLDSLRRRTERQKSEMDEVFNYVDELEINDDIQERKAKFADSEDEENSSLLESMTAAWNRISRASLALNSHMDDMNTTQSIPEEPSRPGNPGNPQSLYDVPRPPRPVEGHLARGASAGNHHVIRLPQDQEGNRESNA
ncbi:polyamine-transporting ATPase 13A3-like isoform X2 [Penaeus japonicus]|uniref:polyamine-transporting ATPase 13A3-like isoform X2 n=1 Tax=Penaeus japonicus TaxID=27405 RepID=UPI001C715DB6|nr:polyamine-transporting ATPase 13A3-like isoform X2 [Penaeus japonicus]